MSKNYKSLISKIKMGNLIKNYGSYERQKNELRFNLG